jgi:hypothetical protein
MTRYFAFTTKAIKDGYNVETFSKEADEIKKHHYCDDFDLYVTTCSTDADGLLWKGMHQGAPHIKGISVSSNDSATIDWFVKTWVKLGYLEPISIETI